MSITSVPKRILLLKCCVWTCQEARVLVVFTTNNEFLNHFLHLPLKILSQNMRTCASWQVRFTKVSSVYRLLFKVTMTFLDERVKKLSIFHSAPPIWFITDFFRECVFPFSPSPPCDLPFCLQSPVSRGKWKCRRSTARPSPCGGRPPPTRTGTDSSGGTRYTCRKSPGKEILLMNQSGKIFSLWVNSM